ncbi:prolyl aminopeptidase [Mycobacterium avium subsp. hominissuis]|uniref:prolyl aminopeptidase n=1 Tax=Mycobacterium avium TaxID=1764 RepID=UPI0026651D0E|nr:prolyl aminopeptidase [Mycobacterium avium]MDO2396111.1 prolyl aminopeptidase [Mycobacterium avium subsp. hominissuis]
MTYKADWLDVGDGNQMFWEVRGNPSGRTVLLVHGGPGSGRSLTAHKAFDHNVFQIVSFDQRGCGNSTPSAAIPTTDMTLNTTEHLLNDMENLRQHLGVDRWLLYGGSWASTLIVAYAQRHPHRVQGIILISVSLTQPSEIDWLYSGLRILLPEAWERFSTALPGNPGQGVNLVEAYRQLMEHPDPAVREQAAQRWCDWEDATIAHERLGQQGQFSAKSTEAKLAFVRICTHFYAHHGWLDDGQLLRDAHRLAGIPGVVIHGRLDLSCPVITAWELARAWSGAELAVIDDCGHTGSPAMATAVRHTIGRFTHGDLSRPS